MFFSSRLQEAAEKTAVEQVEVIKSLKFISCLVCVCVLFLGKSACNSASIIHLFIPSAAQEIVAASAVVRN